LTTVLDAAAPLFAIAFALWGGTVTWLELVAFVMAVAMVVYNIRVNPWGWPLAIASSLLYFLLFWKSRLYGDASLQIFFAIIAGWGWWQWLLGTDSAGEKLHVRELSPRHRWLALGTFAFAWPAMAFFLRRFTDTDVPWWDAFPTAASVIGQYLLGRKYVENWPTWIAVNVVATALFAYKGLALTAVLYAVFVAMSIFGWRRWQRMLVAAP